jgi:hypothetical protein
MANEIAIQNVYDGPKKPSKVIRGGQFKLDFAYSNDAGTVDAGIKETIRGVKLSIMAMGIALYRVDVSGLFIDLGFKKFGEYIDHLADESGMARTSLYNWEYIGEAYIKHRADLDRVGFTDDDGPTKLPFLVRALEHHPKREVFKNIKDMSLREFEQWSKAQINQVDKKYKSVKIVGSQIFIGNNPVISFADGLSPRDKRYFEGLLLEGAIAVKKNEYAKVYRFYDEQEARNFDKYYQRELKTLRAKK